MLDKTFNHIDNFKPSAIDIPVNKCELEAVIVSLYQCMFPICQCSDFKTVHSEMKEVAQKLCDHIARLLDTDKAIAITEYFFSRFDDLHIQLLKDAACYVDNDPAARSLEEVIITYPGFYALSVYRMAHVLYQQGVPLIPRFFTEHAHSKVGIDIHPGAVIGQNFFMDHGTGIVIGETTVIGNNVKIYQGVTLGALYVEKKLSDLKRHPTIEDNVVIYSNATILGGDTVVGHDSVIGGGTWLTHSVIPFSLVYNPADVKIRTVKSFDQPHDFVI